MATRLKGLTESKFLALGTKFATGLRISLRDYAKAAREASCAPKFPFTSPITAYPGEVASGLGEIVSGARIKLTLIRFGPD